MAQPKVIILFVGIGVIIVIIYQVTTSSYTQPSSSVASSLDTQVFPWLTKDNNSISMETGQGQGHMTHVDIFGQWKAVKLPDESRNIKIDSDARKFAVISSATPLNLQEPDSYNYVFDLPLTVIAWQRIGFKSIVFISGSKTTWEKSSILNLVYSYLVDLQTIVYFIDGNAENFVMLSQTSRLFACCLIDVKPQDYIITSDSDLWPINMEKYTLPSGKQLLSTYAYCCEDFSHKSERFRMLPLANLGATVSTWRDIMFGDRGDCMNVTSSAILDYFAEEFGPMVYSPVRKGENAGWYMDQHMASIRIEKWIRKYNDSSILEFATRNIGQDRLDRSSWHPRNLGSLTDTHLLESLYRSEKWVKVHPVLVMLYGEGTTYFSLCQQYRQDFIAEMKATLNVTL